MPLYHFVLLQKKNDISEARVQEMFQRLREMKEAVPGLLQISCGRNLHSDSSRFPYYIMIVGENADAIDRYRQHPLHKPIGREFVAIEGDSIGCDFSA